MLCVSIFQQTALSLFLGNCCYLKRVWSLVLGFGLKPIDWDCCSISSENPSPVTRQVLFSALQPYILGNVCCVLEWGRTHPVGVLGIASPFAPSGSFPYCLFPHIAFDSRSSGILRGPLDPRFAASTGHAHPFLILSLLYSPGCNGIEGSLKPGNEYGFGCGQMWAHAVLLGFSL